MNKKMKLSLIALVVTLMGSQVTAGETQLLWGDTHLHTNLSPDAFIKGNTTATPDDSFNFAKGAPVIDANSRAKIKIETPLDFLVVTDHAEYVGIPKMIWAGDERLMKTKVGKRFAKMIKEGKGTQVFVDLLGTANSGKPYEALNSDEI